MLKLAGYQDRLTEAVLQILILIVRANSSKLTLGYSQLRTNLNPHAAVLGELFE